MGRMNERSNINAQLEMSFGKTRYGRSAARRQRRLSRAQWWVGRMREVVDRAMDWQPAPVVPPEQTCFALAFSQPSFAPRSNSRN